MTCCSLIHSSAAPIFLLISPPCPFSDATGFTGPSARRFTRRVVLLRLQLAEIPLVCVGLDGEYTANELNCRTRGKDENRISVSQGRSERTVFHHCRINCQQLTPGHISQSTLCTATPRFWFPLHRSAAETKTSRSLHFAGVFSMCVV